MKILFMCGSFRTGSLNQVLLDESQHYLAGHAVEQITVHHLPFYDVAIDGENRPPEVQAFLKTVASADAFVFATPEFNHSIPAVLKNAIDWASRPAFNSPLKGKPVTVLTATPSDHGGNLAEAHLKQVLDSTLCAIYPSIRYCLGHADQKIVNGTLVDEQAQRRLQRHIEGFADWASRQRQAD